MTGTIRVTQADRSIDDGQDVTASGYIEAIQSLVFLTIVYTAAIYLTRTVATSRHTVTRMISNGSALQHERSVSVSSIPPLAMVGRMMVTSWDEKLGFRGMGMGLKVQWEMQLTIKRT